MANFDRHGREGQPTFGFARPERVREAVERGQLTNRGPYSILGGRVYRKIRDLLKRGIATKDIAERVGCGDYTVRRELEKMGEPNLN